MRLTSFTAKVKTVSKPTDYTAKLIAQRRWLREQRLKAEEAVRHRMLEQGMEP